MLAGRALTVTADNAVMLHCTQTVSDTLVVYTGSMPNPQRMHNNGKAALTIIEMGIRLWLLAQGLRKAIGAYTSLLVLKAAANETNTLKY